MSCRGFTALELVVVLVLVGGVTAVAVSATGGWQHGLDQGQMVDRVNRLDARARAWCERGGRAGRLTIDPSGGWAEGEEGVVMRFEPKRVVDDADRQAVRRLVVPSGWQVIMARHEDLAWTEQPFTLDIDKDGVSRSYAMLLMTDTHRSQAAGVDQTGGQDIVWLLVAGGSGQVQVFDNREVLDAVFASANSRPHAD